MDNRSLFPPASTRSTFAYCWRQMRPDRVPFVAGWVGVVLSALANAVAAPLVFATLLGRIAALGGHSALWSSFGGLVVTYAVILTASLLVARTAGWLVWGATLRAFARAITNGYDHLIELSHRWHTDRPSGEVISSLETFSWAFVEIVDMVTWGLLRVGAVAVGAVIVLSLVAWPVALVMALLVVAFCGVLWRRMDRVVAAEQEFSDTHSQATGVIADTIANLTTVRTQATEAREKAYVADVVAASVRADLRARRVFSVTRFQMESSMAVLNWAAIVVGLVLALHHVVAAGAIYLILFYATYVGNSLEESFEYVRVISRAVGRSAKFVGIAETDPDIRDEPGARDLVVAAGRIDFRDVWFSYRPDAPLFRGLDLGIEPGEHVGLVGSSGSGKTTLTKLILRFMDIQGGAILLDGQDVARVTQRSLRDHISYVPQDPQMLHRTIAENICYGVPGLSRPDMELVRRVGRAAHVEEFVRALPDGYATVVGERGLKLSGGQRQRVAIAQAMAKAAPFLILDEATSALDSESEVLVQEALWRLMHGATALVVAHRLATIARLDRIVVLEHGSVVEEGTHAELLAASHRGVYRRLWEHQSGGFLAA